MSNIAINPNDGLGIIKIMGTSLSRDYAANCLSARISLTTDQVSQFDMTFADPNYGLMNQGLLRLDQAVDFDAFKMRIGTVSTGVVNATETVTVNCRPEVVRKLKMRTGKKVMKNTSPSNFVIAECKALGIPYHVQSSAKRKNVARDVKKGSTKYLPNEGPSSWTTFSRLARELKFLSFEAAGTFYFGKPTWLLSLVKDNPAIINYKTGALAYRVDQTPECSQSRDGSGERTVSLQVPIARWREFRPGRAIKLDGVSTAFNGYYLVSSVEYDLTGKEPYINVDGVTAIDEGNVYTTPSTSLTSKAAASVVTAALRQAGNAVVEDIQLLPSTSDPTTFDNAELVQWACFRAGIKVPDGYVGLRDYCKEKKTTITVAKGISTRGALLFNDSVQKVAISLGNGRVIEAVDRTYGVSLMATTASKWTMAAKIPGAKY